MNWTLREPAWVSMRLTPLPYRSRPGKKTRIAQKPMLINSNSHLSGMLAIRLIKQTYIRRRPHDNLVAWQKNHLRVIYIEQVERDSFEICWEDILFSWPNSFQTSLSSILSNYVPVDFWTTSCWNLCAWVLGNIMKVFQKGWTALSSPSPHYKKELILPFEYFLQRRTLSPNE